MPSDRDALLGRDEGAPSRTAALAHIAFERTGLFIAVFGFALLIIKVSRVSHLNPRTSHGLVEGVGPVSVVLGTLVGHFPVIFFIVSALALWWAVGSLSVLKTFMFGHAAVGGGLLFALLLLPWPYLVVLAVVGVVRWLRSRAAPHHVGRGGRHYYVLGGALAILLLADSDVWFPPETFFVEGESPFVGYALSEPGNASGWVVILTDEERMIVRVRQDELTDRKPCRHHEEDLELGNFPSLFQLAIRERAELPEPLCEA